MTRYLAAETVGNPVANIAIFGVFVLVTLFVVIRGDQIVVKLADPLRFTYDLRMLKLAGTFHVRMPGSPGAVPGVFYHLDADHLQ